MFRSKIWSWTMKYAHFCISDGVTPHIVQAINSMLIGLPIKLHTGSISAVTVRIPWPNPLTSTVGLSIQSLHLIFHIPATSEPISLSTIADSVASAAKSFIHNELTDHEETTLRGFFNSDSASSFRDYTDRVPGIVDPFLHPTDNQGNVPEGDPAGMVIFATLVKRLLANSELDAIDTKVTIIHPAHASFTFSIAEIRYRINGAAGKASGGDKAESEQTSGETRNISILGLTVSARDLLPSPMLLTPSLAPSPDGSSRFPFGPLSPHWPSSVSAVSSASPLNEDLEIAVSESLANLQLQLTPDAPSPSSSIPNETMPLAFVDRHEATGRRSVTLPSGGHTCSETEFFQPSSSRKEEDMAREPDFKRKDEMILSHGPEPIVIGLRMPSTSALMQDLAEESPSRSQSPQPTYYPPSKSDKSGGATNIGYHFSAGVFACAFRAWHIRGMLDMLDAWDWGSHQPPTLSVIPSKSSSSANFVDTLCALGLDASMKVRGVVMLLLPSTILGEPFLPDSFFNCPLVPPRLPQGYTYITLENLSTSCSLSHPTPTVPAASQTRTRAAATSKTNCVTIDFTLEDLSAFALLAIQTTNHDKQPLARPILITDQSLHMQYPVTHIHPGSHVRETHDYPSLPDFSILDWTAEARRSSSTAIPPWRTDASAMASQAQSSVDVRAPSLPRGRPSKSGSGDVPAIAMKAKFTWASSESGQYSGRGLDDHIEMDVVPLHIFVDLGLVLSDNALAFLDEMVSCRTDVVVEGRNNVGDGKHDEERDERTEGESDNGKVDGLVLDTLGLDVDGQDNEPAKKGGLAGINHSSLRPQAEKVF
jgi:autophagy-related protein 2